MSFCLSAQSSAFKYHHRQRKGRETSLRIHVRQQSVYETRSPQEATATRTFLNTKWVSPVGMFLLTFPPTPSLQSLSTVNCVRSEESKRHHHHAHHQREEKDLVKWHDDRVNRSRQNGKRDRNWQTQILPCSQSLLFPMTLREEDKEEMMTSPHAMFLFESFSSSHFFDWDVTRLFLLVFWRRSLGNELLKLKALSLPLGKTCHEKRLTLTKDCIVSFSTFFLSTKMTSSLPFLSQHQHHHHH